jgi:hypothetical protein
MNFLKFAEENMSSLGGDSQMPRVTLENIYEEVQRVHTLGLRGEDVMENLRQRMEDTRCLAFIESQGGKEILAALEPPLPKRYLVRICGLGLC